MTYEEVKPIIGESRIAYSKLNLLEECGVVCRCGMGVVFSRANLTSPITYVRCPNCNFVIAYIEMKKEIEK